jgi:TfoX/Sxy family transcriptional regulator of competence genes
MTAHRCGGWQAVRIGRTSPSVWLLLSPWVPGGGAGTTIVAMAYDEDLADRIRELTAGEAQMGEKKMFGGLAFLIAGNMAVAASGQGGLLVRVDPAQSDKLVSSTSARNMEMRGRSMQGWLLVSSEDLRTKRQLTKWVKLGTSYARSLPAKR